MALERTDFERMYRDVLPGLSAAERALLEEIYGLGKNGKGPKLAKAVRAKLWKEIQDKLNDARRRNYGMG